MFVYMKVDNLKKFYLFKQADSNFNKINFFPGFRTTAPF